MITETLQNLTLINGDCMDYMRTLKDNEFDLSITDPPYGGLRFDCKTSFHKGAFTQYPKGKRWDTRPPREYFNELQRVSKNQIIWGANYFVDLCDFSGWSWLCWNKQQSENCYNFSMGELAVYSGKKPLKIFDYSFLKNKNNSVNPYRAKNVKFHPCQKPIALYKWLLKHYATAGDKIFDSHLGSGTSAMACHDAGYVFTGIEIDKDYFDNALKHIEWHQRQLKLFDNELKPNIYG